MDAPLSYSKQKGRVHDLCVLEKRSPSTLLPRQYKTSPMRSLFQLGFRWRARARDDAYRQPEETATTLGEI